MILQQLVNSHPVCRVIFATSALGMGADAPNIERIIHIGPPRSLEAYFHETGRAGRGGNQAEAVLYYNNTDISKSVKEMSNSVRSYCLSEDFFASGNNMRLNLKMPPASDWLILLPQFHVYYERLRLRHRRQKKTGRQMISK